jgi:hypothetical protein
MANVSPVTCDGAGPSRASIDGLPVFVLLSSNFAINLFSSAIRPASFYTSFLVCGGCI